jgi:hypothetical protein
VETVRDLITEALAEIGVLAMGQPVPDEYAARALSRLVTMADEFRAKRRFLYTVAHTPFTLTANQQTRTIGLVGANFVAARPIWIPPGAVVRRVGSTLDEPLYPFDSREDWFREPNKTLTDVVPYKYLYEPTNPNGTFTFWPIPTSAATVYFPLPVTLDAVADLNTLLAFPPGYEAMWLYSLAERCCEPFRKTLSPWLANRARDARDTVLDLNEPPVPYVRSDPGLMGAAAFNIQSNRYGR